MKFLLLFRLETYRIKKKENVRKVMFEAEDAIGIESTQSLKELLNFFINFKRSIEFV